MAGSMPGASAACLMLIAPVLIDSKICRVFGSVLATVGRWWTIFFKFEKKLPKICLLLRPACYIPSVLQVPKCLPTNGEIDFCGWRGIKQLGYTCIAWPPMQKMFVCGLCMCNEEATYIAHTECHRKPLTAPQHPSCRFLYFSPPEIWIQLELGYHPENLE